MCVGVDGVDEGRKGSLAVDLQSFRNTSKTGCTWHADFQVHGPLFRSYLHWACRDGKCNGRCQPDTLYIIFVFWFVFWFP